MGNSTACQGPATQSPCRTPSVQGVMMMLNQQPESRSCSSPPAPDPPSGHRLPYDTPFLTDLGPVETVTEGNVGTGGDGGPSSFNSSIV